MNDNKNLLIISYGKYPNGNAGAVRQHAFAKLFMSVGYSVTVIGMGDSTDFEMKEYDGVNYISFRKSPNNLKNRVLNWLLYCKRLKNFLKQHENEYSAFLFIKSYFPSVIRYIKKYSKKHNIVLYHDSVEWYSPEEFKYGKADPGYIKNNSLNTKYIDKHFKVIAISKFLEEHFKSRGIDTVRIPVIMDSETIETKKIHSSDKVVVSYAGRIGKKDYIGNIINGFLSLDDEHKAKIELRLMGANLSQVAGITGISEDVLKANSQLIHCMGRVPREVVLENLQSSDFTVLIRDASLRYAKAGFPTKVVESLMSATPVICNLSSDLNCYLTDGYNAVIVDSMSSDDVCKALIKASEFTLEQRENMQKQARITAEKYFDYRNYTEMFDKWSNS